MLIVNHVTFFKKYLTNLSKCLEKIAVEKSDEFKELRRVVVDPKSFDTCTITMPFTLITGFVYKYNCVVYHLLRGRARNTCRMNDGMQP